MTPESRCQNTIQQVYQVLTCVQYMPVLSRTGPAFLPFGLYEASGNWLETGVTKVKLTQSVVEAATPVLSSRHSSGTGKPASTRFDGFKDLAIRKSRLPDAVELLNEKILLLTAWLLLGDYRGMLVPASLLSYRTVLCSGNRSSACSAGYCAIFLLPFGCNHSRRGHWSGRRTSHQRSLRNEPNPVPVIEDLSQPKNHVEEEAE